MAKPALAPTHKITTAKLTGLKRQMAGIYNDYGLRLQQKAQELGIDVDSAAAVLKVESGGHAFTTVKGEEREIIRFENHVFFDQYTNKGANKARVAQFNKHFRMGAGKNRWKEHRWRRTENDAWQEFHGKQTSEYEVLDFAASLDGPAAYNSISMGLGQQMGFNAKSLGYKSSQAMFDAFKDEGNQVDAVFTFVKSRPAALKALKNKDYVAFAKVYNGSGQAPAYGARIHEAATAYKDVTHGITAEKPVGTEETSPTPAHNDLSTQIIRKFASVPAAAYPASLQGGPRLRQGEGPLSFSAQIAARHAQPEVAAIKQRSTVKSFIDGELTGPWYPPFYTGKTHFDQPLSELAASSPGAIVFVNGIMTDSAAHVTDAEALARSEGRPVVGVYNLSDKVKDGAVSGILADSWQAFSDTEGDLCLNPATYRVRNLIRQFGNLHLVGHSQGSLIIAEALRQAKGDHTDIRRIQADLVGTQAFSLPRGPNYFLLVESNDSFALFPRTALELAHAALHPYARGGDELSDYEIAQHCEIMSEGGGHDAVHYLDRLKSYRELHASSSPSGPLDFTKYVLLKTGFVSAPLLQLDELVVDCVKTALTKFGALAHMVGSGAATFARWIGRKVRHGLQVAGQTITRAARGFATGVRKLGQGAAHLASTGWAATKRLATSGASAIASSAHALAGWARGIFERHPVSEHHSSAMAAPWLSRLFAAAGLNTQGQHEPHLHGYPAFSAGFTGRLRHVWPTLLGGPIGEHNPGHLSAHARALGPAGRPYVHGDTHTVQAADTARSVRQNLIIKKNHVTLTHLPPGYYAGRKMRSFDPEHHTAVVEHGPHDNRVTEAARSVRQNLIIKKNNVTITHLPPGYYAGSHSPSQAGPAAPSKPGASPFAPHVSFQTGTRAAAPPLHHDDAHPIEASHAGHARFGSDPRTHLIKKKNQITLSHLPPGTYTRHVQRSGQGDHPDVDAGALRESLLAQSGGFAPDTRLREHLASPLGFDPAGARLHHGPAAAQAARMLSAEAFTIGRDVFFGAGAYEPSSSRGMSLIAHELTHVGQQTGTIGDRTRFFTESGGDAMEREAQQVGERVLANAGRRGGLFVESYVREYEPEGDRPLGDADRQRLDHISLLALQEAERELGALQVAGLLGDISVDIEIDLVEMTDQQAAAIWSSALVAQVRAASRAGVAVGLPGRTMRQVQRAPKEDAPPPQPATALTQGGKANLHDQMAAVESVQPVEGVSDMYQIVVGGQTVTIDQSQRDKLVAEVTRTLHFAIRSIRIKATGVLGRYNEQKQLNDEQWFSSGISRAIGTFSGRYDPGEQVERLVASSLSMADRADAALSGGKFRSVAIFMSQAEEFEQQAHNLVEAWIDGLIESAETVVKTLEFTETAAFITVGVIATIVTAGAAAGAAGAAGAGAATTTAFGVEVSAVSAAEVISIGAPVVATVAQAGTKEALGMHVDWTRVAVDAVANIVLSKFGGKLADGMFSALAKMPGMRQAMAKITSTAFEHILKSVLAQEAAAVFNTIIDATYRKFAGEKVTWSEFLHELLDQLTDPKGLAIAILMGAVTHHAQKMSDKEVARRRRREETEQDSTEESAPRSAGPSGPRDEIRSEGSWEKLKEKAQADPALHEQLVQARNEILAKARTEFEEKFPDLSWEQMGAATKMSNDADITIKPKKAGTPQEIAAALEQSAEAVEFVREKLVDASGGEPGTTLDANVYTAPWSDAEIPLPPAQRAAVDLQNDSAGLAAMKRSMTQEQWEAFKAETLRRAAPSGPEHEVGASQYGYEKATLEQVKARLEQAEATAEAVDTALQGGKPATETAETFRKEMLEALKAGDVAKARELQTRLKLMEPGAYATTAAYENVVGAEQTMARGKSKFEPLSKDPHANAQAAADIYAQMEQHAKSGALMDRLKAVAKGRARLELEAGRPGEVPYIEENFSQDRMWDNYNQQRSPNEAPATTGQDAALRRMVVDWAGGPKQAIYTDRLAEEFIRAQLAGGRDVVTRLTLESAGLRGLSPSKPAGQEGSGGPPSPPPPSESGGEPAGPRKGGRPDKQPANLDEKLVLEEARNGAGVVAMENLGDEPRLVAVYGPGKWVKMSHVKYVHEAKSITGEPDNLERSSPDKRSAVQIEVHWFRNETTGQDVEFKFKRRMVLNAPEE